MSDKKTTVLICDDAVFMRMMLRDFLTKDGFQIVGEVGNGKSAVEAYRKLHPDLVLMDITMPELDGLEASKQILAKDPGATIIMLLTRDMEAIRYSAAQEGVMGFLFKPFSQAGVLNTVRETLANQ